MANASMWPYQKNLVLLNVPASPLGIQKPDRDPGIVQCLDYGREASPLRSHVADASR